VTFALSRLPMPGWRCLRPAIAVGMMMLAGCASAPAASPAGTRPSASATNAAKPGPAESLTRVAAPATAVSPFARLRRYLSGRAGEVTAAVYDANTKQTWVLHPGVVQDTASIVKVEIMGTALTEDESGASPLPASEAALTPSMIENSDNQSATTLLADVGGAKAVARFDRSLGMRHTTPSSLALIPGTPWPGWGLTTTTALDEVTLVSAFAYPNAVLSAASRSYGLSLMEHVEADQDWGVSGGVAAGSTVALKNGWLPLGPSGWQVNSIGWILGHGRNYVLAVLTDGNPTESYGIGTITHMARVIFARLGHPG
jgi:beta-lactamase class A